MKKLDETKELEERFTQLRKDLDEGNLQEFRDKFLEMHIYEQGQFYQSLKKNNVFWFIPIFHQKNWQICLT